MALMTPALEELLFLVDLESREERREKLRRWVDEHVHTAMGRSVVSAHLVLVMKDQKQAADFVEEMRQRAVDNAGSWAARKATITAVDLPDGDRELRAALTVLA